MLLDNEADKLIDDILNDDGGTLPTEEVEDKPATPTGNETKAFSERLNKERAKLKSELAKSLGYDSWEEATEARANDVLLDHGIDLETVKPVLKDLLKSDPDYIAAMEYKRDREEIEKNLWAENELKKLNSKFNLDIKSIDDLGEDVIKLWNSGLSLEKAYAAEHFDEIQSKAVSIAKNKGTGKDHLVPTPGGVDNGGKTQIKPTAAEVKMFKSLMPGITDEEIIKYINK